jgi:hypothetical protein
MSIRLFNPSGGYIDLNAGGDGTAANVFTLPAETGTLLTSATAVTSIPGYGNLTEADQWYLTANLTGPTGTISSNLSRLTTGAAGYLGTGMSESSGIFTFPSTGYWLVQFSFLASNISAGSGDRVGVYVSATLNNSSYVFIAEAGASLDGTAANAQNGGFTQAIIDVTDTANVKVRFDVSSFAATSVLLGDANRLRTGFSFIRLGDT